MKRKEVLISEKKINVAQLKAFSNTEKIIHIVSLILIISRLETYNVSFAKLVFQAKSVALLL